jgi:hypothetical protein
MKAAPDGRHQVKVSVHIANASTIRSVPFAQRHRSICGRCSGRYSSSQMSLLVCGRYSSYRSIANTVGNPNAVFSVNIDVKLTIISFISVFSFICQLETAAGNSPHLERITISDNSSNVSMAWTSCQGDMQLKLRTTRD